MSEEKCCGTCKYHDRDGNGEYICENKDSENCACWTMYLETCEEWEER